MEAEHPPYVNAGINAGRVFLLPYGVSKLLEDHFLVQLDSSGQNANHLWHSNLSLIVSLSAAPPLQ